MANIYTTTTSTNKDNYIWVDLSGGVNNSIDRIDEKEIKKEMKKLVKSASKVESTPQKQMDKQLERVDYLEKLGLKKVANKLMIELEIQEKENKLHQLGYRRITKEALKKLQNYLLDTSKRLKATFIENYETIPPQRVLEKLKQAKEHNIFKDFVVLSVEKVPDPLLVGIIDEWQEGTPITDYNCYFIDIWGKDIPISKLEVEE